MGGDERILSHLFPHLVLEQQPGGAHHRTRVVQSTARVIVAQHVLLGQQLVQSAGHVAQRRALVVVVAVHEPQRRGTRRHRLPIPITSHTTISTEVSN